MNLRNESTMAGKKSRLPRNDPQFFLRAGSIVIAATVIALLAGCSSNTAAPKPGTSSPGSSNPATSVVQPGIGPAPIPTRTAPPTTAIPTITTPEGGPALLDYRAPSTFTCLTGTPNQAQVTIGWSSPSSTDVSFTLDGIPLVSGIQSTLPYQVPGGGPTGVGAAIVFACGPATEHTIKATWRMNNSPPTEREIHITKDSAP